MWCGVSRWHNGEWVCEDWIDWTALTSDAGGRDGTLKVGSASLTLTREILALTSTVHPSLAFLSRVSILLLLAGGAHRMEHSARFPALLIGRLYFPSIPAREARRCSLISHTSPTQGMESSPTPTQNPGK